MKEKQESPRDLFFLKRFPTPPRQNRWRREILNTSPLAGLPRSRGQTEKTSKGDFFPRESVLWMLVLGAHMGRFPIKSANFPPSPLMEGQLSGKRGVFSLINQQNISVQLLRAFYIITLLLKKGARILLINEGDEKNLSRQIFPSYTRAAAKGYHHNQEKQVVSGERLIVSQGVWKGGTCSNWLEICKKVWNWGHCEQFLAHSPEGKQEKKVLARKTQSFQQISSANPRWSRKTPLLYYTKKPDVILVLTGKKSSSLIGEAQALKVPLLYMADTDFGEIQSTFGPSSCRGKSGAGLKETFHQQSLFTNAAYPCIVNSDSFPLSFLLSSLLVELTCSGKKKVKKAVSFR